MGTPKRSVAGKPAAPVYQLKVVLPGTPLIWRRLLVPGDANLSWLHAVLQTAMGWTNSHLHHFLTAEARYSDSRFHGERFLSEPLDRDEAKAVLMEVAPRAGDCFGYEYDFGDSWMHEVRVEKVLPAGAGPADAARCVAGARACPPEDCGGIGGYAGLLRVLKNPRHPEHKTMREWIGGAFDPGAFDCDGVNGWLGRLKWPRVTEAQLRKVLMGRDRETGRWMME